VLAVVHRNQQQWADALESIENAVAVSMCASRRSVNQGSVGIGPHSSRPLICCMRAQLVEKDATAADESLASQIQARLLRAQAAAANECLSSLVYSSARGVPPPAPDAPTHCPVCGPTHWRLRPHEPTALSLRSCSASAVVCIGRCRLGHGVARGVVEQHPVALRYVRDCDR
jgi:hypothetical protein